MTNRWNHRLFSWPTAVLALFLLSGRPLLAAQPEWKIGLILCLTGECAADGNSALKGAQIAADEINARGGVLGKKITFVAEDTDEAVSGARAVTAYKSLRARPDIRYFIGPTWTPAGLSLAPIVSNDLEVIMTSPSLGIAEFHKAGDNIFNTRGTDELPTRMAARRAFARGFRRAAIFSSEQPWESAQGRFFRDEFERLGGKVEVFVEPLPIVTTLGAEALKVASAKPDVVFFANFIQQPIAARELKRLNFEGAKFAATIDDSRLREAQGTLEGAEFFTYQKPSTEFKNKFHERFGIDPEIPAGTGYDTIYAYSKAVESAGTFDVLPVKKELSKVKLSGASGELSFDSDGCAAKKPLLWAVRGTEFVRVEPSE